MLHAGSLTGRGGEQVAQAIVSTVAGSAVVGYAVVKLGYDCIVDCCYWIQQKGNARSAKKEEEKRKENKYQRQLIEAKAREEVYLTHKAQQAACTQRVSAVFENCVQELNTYCQNLEDIVIYGEDAPLGIEKHCFIQRYNALNDHLHGNDIWIEQTYKLSSNGQALLEDQSIPHAPYLSFYGNQIQHVLHKEYIGILDKAAQFPQKNPLMGLECKNIAATVAQFAHAGQMHNHAGAITQSFLFADFCHGMLYVSEQCIEIQCDMGNAIKRGALQGAYNIKNGAYSIYHALCEPCQTLKGGIKGVGQLILVTAQITEYVETSIIEHKTNMRLKAQQDRYDIVSGKYTEQFIFERDKAISDKKYKETVDYVHNYLSTTWKRLDYDFSLYSIEKGTELAVGMLPAYALKALSVLMGKGASSLNAFIESGALEQDFYSIGCNGNTLHAAVSYQALVAHEAVIALETVGVVAADVLDGASKIAPAVTVPGGFKEPLSNAGEILPDPSIDIIEATIPLTEAELKDLQQYVGIETHNGYPIVPPFEHTWVAKIAKSGKITGFHQDRGGYYRKLGLIKDIHMFEGGFYKAKVYFKGEWIERSYFPEGWSAGELMDCYYKIINSKNIKNITEMRTTFELKLQADVTIRLVLENTGTGVTFFPKLLS